MSSTYRPNVNNVNAGPLTVIPKSTPTNQLEQAISSCDGCISLATTQNYRSAYDKAYLPIYQTQLANVNTDLETTRFAY